MAKLRKITKSCIVECLSPMEAAVRIFGPEVKIHCHDRKYWVYESSPAIITEISYGVYRVERYRVED